MRWRKEKVIRLSKKKEKRKDGNVFITKFFKTLLRSLCRKVNIYMKQFSFHPPQFRIVVVIISTQQQSESDIQYVFTNDCGKAVKLFV